MKSHDWQKLTIPQDPDEHGMETYYREQNLGSSLPVVHCEEQRNFEIDKATTNTKRVWALAQRYEMKGN